ncbi:MAG: DUF3667 domain-containing protein [Myxococcota bacterium]
MDDRPHEAWEQRLARRLATPTEIQDVETEGPTPCLNCQAEVRWAYCPKCGQRRGDYRRSLLGFVREFVAETLEIDGRVGRTLRLLLFRPGALTREFALGRRQRYVSPLRLYLFMSLLLFGSVSLFGKVQSMGGPPSPPPAGAEVPGVEIDRTGLEGTFLEDVTRARLAQLEAMPVEQAGAELFWSGIERLPLTMFLLLPVFALLLKLSMLGTGRYYVEHLVFAVHVHCFWFLLVFAVFALGLLTDAAALLLFVIPGYTVFALQYAYDASWGATLARSVVLWFVYGLALFVAVLVAFLVGALFG